MYTKVSIPRNEEGGAASIKNPTVILIDVADVETEPTRTFGNAKVTGSFALKTGAKAVGIYATPSTIAITEEQSGNADARGLTKGVEFTHPGDSVAIASHTEAFLNRPVIALIRSCADNVVRVIGSVCNPLYMQPEYTNNNEATSRRFVYKQEQADKYAVGFYTGTLPTLADEASDESASSEESA